MKFSSKENFILKECVRRVQCFKNGDPTKYQLLPAYKSEVNSLMTKGILKVDGAYQSRCIGWYSFTPKGIELFNKLKEQGLVGEIRDYSGDSIGEIPKEIEL
jgi:hypothetical protein